MTSYTETQGTGLSSVQTTRGLPQTRLAYLDAIRGIAALIVVLHHCWSAFAPISLTSHGSFAASVTAGSASIFAYSLDKFFEAGRAAVIIFFVLSGFVLTCSLSARPMPFKGFIIKRILRIYPAFMVVILASYCLHYLIGNHPAATATEFLKHACHSSLSVTILVQHLLMIGTEATMRLDAVMWTLVYEMRISLLFPAILLSVMRYRWRAVLVYFLVSVGCAVSLFFANGEIASGSNDASFAATILETGFFIVFFAAGAYLAIAREKVSIEIAKLPLWSKALMSAATAYCIYKGVNYHDVWGTDSDYFHGLGALGVIALAIGVPRIAKALAHQIPIWLGRISYSLYLVHMPILYAVSQTFAKSWPPLSVAIAVVALSLLAADLLAKTIEFPFMRLGKRLTVETM